MAEISRKSIPFGRFKTPQKRSAEYLETLHKWGALDGPVIVEEAARLLASLCRQNEQALSKILRDSIDSQELNFFGLELSDAGPQWRAGYVRRLDTLQPLAKSDMGGVSVYTCELLPGPIHWDAIGILPEDAVAMLAKRGRKIPHELLDLLRKDGMREPVPTESKAPGVEKADHALAQVSEKGMGTQPAPPEIPNASDVPAQRVNTLKKAALVADLAHEWPSINADLSEATRNGLRDAAHTGKHGEWDREKARDWAISKGKVKQATPTQFLAAWPGKTTRHTIDR